MTMITSRRTFLAAPIALPLVACPSPTLAAPADVTGTLTRLIATYVNAERDYDRFCDEVHNPARKRQDAMIAAIPHFEIDATLAGDGSRVWSTREGNGGEALGIAAIADSDQSQTPAWQDKLRRARAFADAHYERQRAIDRTEEAAGLGIVGAQEDEICARLDSSRQAIHDFPARTVSDLRAKLEALDEWLTHAEMRDMTMSDLDSIQSMGI